MTQTKLLRAEIESVVEFALAMFAALLASNRNFVRLRTVAK
jgi:hypothetical protein